MVWFNNLSCKIQNKINIYFQSGKSRSIKQFHYMLWPDFGVPSTPETFLEFLYDIRDSGVFDADMGPPVIHCR